MSRVSENSSSASLRFSLNKTKAKMEDLQMKGSSLKRIARPSDDPISNVEAMSITNNVHNNNQYIRNSDYALLFLSTTEKSLSQLTDILSKAKEIAIAQSSDFYDSKIRGNISNEVKQLREQALAISNRRIGQKFIFSGHKTLTRPFDGKGTYSGDNKNIKVEVSRDFFVPINMNGREVFYSASKLSNHLDNTFNKKEELLNGQDPKNKDGQLIPASDNPNSKAIGRDLASVPSSEKGFNDNSNLFAELDALRVALESNDPELIQNLLPKFDESVNRLITLRTRVGSIVNSIEHGKIDTEDNTIDQKARRSKLVDADIAELFSDITKEQQILKTTYRAAESVLQPTLLDFIK